MTPLSIFSVNLLSEHLLLLGSILIFVSVLVSKVWTRFGVPSLLLFLLLGMAAGADGIGVRFEEYEWAESIGHFAMTIILFTAGLETSASETRPVMKRGVMLSTVGVILTVLFTGTFIALVFGARSGAPILACFLLAAVLSPTDSASVFSVLHGKRLHLREHLGPTLELESGSNDPMAYSLTLILSQLLVSGKAMGPGAQFFTGLGLLALQLTVGFAVGVAVGFLSKWVLDRLRLPGSAIYSVFILSIGFFANGLAFLLRGNGLIAIYIAAVIISNRARIPRKRDVLNFFEGMTWLMQLVMFLMLGLLARPSQMFKLLVPALLIALFMMLVARPAGVFLSLLPSRDLPFKAKLFTSWVGLKGAGPILFSLYPVVVGLEGASDMFNIVFLITLFSLLLQGSTLGPVAKLLKLSYDEDPQAETFGMEIPEEMGMLRDHTVTEEDLARGATLRDLSLPHGIRVMMVRRGERYLVPHGSMPLEVGDRLVIIMGETDD